MNKWKNQFEDVLVICNSILHDLFRDVVESQVIFPYVNNGFYHVIGLSLKKLSFILIFQSYDDNAYQKYCDADTNDELVLYKLYYNYCSVLQFMLV